MQWINAHHGNSPIARHAISVLETVGALDLAFDTFVVTLLDGETDTSGYPEYNAIVGGVASHWDEATGDMIVRALAGWGGKGVRGDTDRTATRILAGLLTNILASQYAIGLTPLDRPVPAAGRGGLVCAHCGFASVHDRALLLPQVRHAPAARLDRPTPVPFYDYVCQACGRRIEVMHGVHATGPERCDACGGRMQRVISRPAIHFKGSGWAKMDARVSSAVGRPRPRVERRGRRRFEQRGHAGRRRREQGRDAGQARPRADGGTDGAKPAKAGRPSAARSRSRDEA